MILGRLADKRYRQGWVSTGMDVEKRDGKEKGK